MSTLEATSILVTCEHFLKGNVKTGGQRLLEVLKDQGSEFLRIQNVQVFRRNCGTRIANVTEGIVRKSSIALVIPASDKHEAPQRRIDAFVPKKEHDVFLVVLGYEIRGKMQLHATADPVTVMCREMGDFVPVTRGSVSFNGSNWREQTPQVIIANQSFLSLFQIGQPTDADVTVSVADGNER